MPIYEDLIDELSGLCGIVPEYWDVFGIRHVASQETKRAILRAMGMNIDSAEGVAEEIRKVRGRPWNNFLDPVKVISVHDQPFFLSVFIPVPEGEEGRLSLSWSVEDEQGKRFEYLLTGDAVVVSGQKWVDGIRYIEVRLQDTGTRDIGYYFINVLCRHPDAVFPDGKNFMRKASRVIIAPDRCYLPPDLETGRTWGLSVNLYAVRSSRNWGVGDFTDLKDILGTISGLGGGFVGINPLHAIPNKAPYGISPYSPISRLYKNFIYLDMDSIPDVAESEEAQKVMQSEIFHRQIEEVRRSPCIEYKKIAFLKKTILQFAFEHFCDNHYRKSTERGEDFRRYVREESVTLESYALFVALWEYMNATRKVYIWQDWDSEYFDPEGSAVREFRDSHEEDVLFYKYLQWLIEVQHREAAEGASRSGMPVGIYHDLAIGSIGGGSNAWSYQGLIAGSIDVGAPPDDFNITGQNWNFPPMVPERLRETGYEFFTDIIRRNMKHNGALRIDHALGMFRLFWIPCGMPAVEGAYVIYPVEDLLRIIALESVRNKTMVIAEDLGTVGENVHDTLFRFRMHSYRLLYFGRNYPDPSFTRPEHYPETALCTVTTHDLPTLYGYWIGRDLESKKLLSLFRDEEQWQRFVRDRERDKGLLLEALKSKGILPPGYPADPSQIPSMTEELCLAIYEYLARTPCKLTAVSLDDLIGTLDQQNMPGTTSECPNWVQKTPLLLDSLPGDSRFVSMAEMFRRNGR
ncbi:MAG: 4-alpha-glucanotransferase [Alphaproteobacteria bacterium]|uniref:4-alpha-glucanotransferase n=1 Tax=Candidatus Nitrobium versatile TaxID=2884831 RepID=A0A953JET0_9BACT|nr:4-alpha-glucanotransferase [Candidatus Nitrobium versatile]